MNTSKIMEYLSNLEMHNERQWYHTNKQMYREAHSEFLNLLEQLILQIGQTDPSILKSNPSDLTFKLVRDTRFSHDKSPYNPCFRAHISSAGKLPIPVGYFVKIQPGNRSFLGGGLFADMFKDATSMVRDYIASHGEEWERIISNKAFIDNFTVKGECLKNVPRGFDPEHPQAEYLKNKSWYLEYPISDEQVKDSDGFLKLAADVFTLMQPFNTYLNKALLGFEMPKR